MFCYNAGCYPCFDCGKVFRQNRLRCSKEPSDCGECLLGYKEDSYKTSHYHWCRLDVTRAEPRKTDNPDDSWTANVRANYQFSNPPPSYKEEDIPVRG
ncbi:hypothetical protein V9T40_014608 [Parthenolecanium corni]|uniref:Uncharacterized protein n=1 Tax=Parthenolecanium corni TaxID=536013 RepID=A0AAN9T656_9HEMI